MGDRTTAKEGAKINSEETKQADKGRLTEQTAEAIAPEDNGARHANDKRIKRMDERLTYHHFEDRSMTRSTRNDVLPSRTLSFAVIATTATAPATQTKIGAPRKDSSCSVLIPLASIP